MVIRNRLTVTDLNYFKLNTAVCSIQFIIVKVMNASQANDSNKQSCSSPHNSSIVMRDNIHTVEFKQYSDKYFYATLTDQKRNIKNKKKTTTMDLSMATTMPRVDMMNHLSAPVGVDSDIKTLILQNKLLQLTNSIHKDSFNKEDKDIDRAMRKIDAAVILDSKTAKKLSTRRIIAECRQNNLSGKEK